MPWKIGDAVDVPAKLHGWNPSIQGPEDLHRVIELAFGYRGHTTVVTKAGEKVFGYLFNRDLKAARPFVQVLQPGLPGPTTIPCAEISGIEFTGKDTAAAD